MEDAGVRPTLYMYQSVLPYMWRDNSMDYVTLMQEKISMIFLLLTLAEEVCTPSGPKYLLQVLRQVFRAEGV
jgi:hypothetical protein